jgi:hypothetical protein
MEQRSWGTQNIVFDGSPFYEDFWIQSAGMWTGTFEGTNVSVHVGAASGNQWRVKLDYSLVGVAWADTYDGWIRINPDTLAQSDTFIKNTISHEIGELLGIGHSECSGSVMSVLQPNQVTPQTPIFPSSSERCTVEQNYLARTDNDGDGFSPDDPEGSSGWDCDDNDPLKGSNCEGECPDESCTPIVIPLSERGVRLSDLSEGVYFDIAARGTPNLVAWPLDVDSAWLAMDRNGNGKIDSGSELFGNSTRLRSGIVARHGFEALAELDDDGDGVIDARDSAFQQLRLWRDTIRDGLCHAQELVTLESAGILSIGVEAKEARRVDRWGNEFRYRALVSAVDAPVQRYAYDVIIRVLWP